VQIADRARLLPTSRTLEINALAQKLRSQGVDVVNMTAGEPDFPTPQPVIEAAINALNSGKTKYTAAAGIPELRQKIAERVQRRYRVKCSARQVVVTNGGKQALFNAIASVISSGDEILLISPCWVSYEPQVALMGGVVKYVKTSIEENFLPRAQDVAKAVTPRTKAIIVNSPNNPTGAVYGRETLQSIANIALRNNITIISDEVYDSLVYDGEYTSLYGLCHGENVILINAFSKSHAMTGWRVGYLVASEEVAECVSKIQAHSTSNVCTVSQYAALAALDTDTSYMREKFRKRRDFVAQKLSRMNLTFSVPRGAFYFLIDVRSVAQNDAEFCVELLQKSYVALVPGSAFNAPGYVRLSFALGENKLEKGLERLKAFLGG